MEESKRAMSNDPGYGGQEGLSAVGLVLIVFVPVIGILVEANGWISRLLAALLLFALAFGFGWLLASEHRKEHIRQLEMQIEAYEWAYEQDKYKRGGEVERK